MMPLRRGVHAALEDEANRLIRESLVNVTRHADKSDILTPWKEQERRRREVMVPSGVPDKSNREGIFHRVMNSTSPHLNSTSVVRRSRFGSSLTSSVPESSGEPVNFGGGWDSE